ncbi:hypothetical protein BaRGS_00009258 [Batillaria attramentaria]|uniref:Uncharacterized protein n=1 Tax=Batillaria attramentaria TaxID=370345 RepID=A0ABD0LK80_9CAEN
MSGTTGNTAVTYLLVIDEQNVDSSRKLHSRAKDIDRYLQVYTKTYPGSHCVCVQPSDCCAKRGSEEIEPAD